MYNLTAMITNSHSLCRRQIYATLNEKNRTHLASTLARLITYQAESQQASAYLHGTCGR
jgi:hypothetical protein